MSGIQVGSRVIALDDEEYATGNALVGEVKSLNPNGRVEIWWEDGFHTSEHPHILKVVDPK